MKNRRVLILRIAAALALVALVAFVGFYVWATAIPAPLPEAMRALNSDEHVSIEIGRWLVFTPINQAPRVGLVFYPGGKVDPRAYAPFAREIALRGYLVVIVPMPLNLAVFGEGLAAEVIRAYPRIQRWAVGGHSLGGSMAAQFAYEHPAQIQGLALWASYPPNNIDLSSQNLAVVSISGSRDGLATPEKIQASRQLLPANTTWVAIKGGNHAQFGWYGPQQGDNPAKISRPDQQGQTVDATAAMLAALNR